MDEAPEIEEMSVPDSAWAMWSHASNVDTKDRCSCGHKGLGPAWHTDDCRGANAALTDKVQELMHELYEQWREVHLEKCGWLEANDYCPLEYTQKCFWPRPKGLQF